MISRKSSIQSPVSKRLLARMLGVVVSVAVCSQNCFGQTTNAPGRLTYDAFRTISDKNIFNPNRFARATGRTQSRTQSTRPASRVEAITLVGLMQYERGVFAFFDGTSGDYKKTIQHEGAVGEYKVTGVTPRHVTLVHGTNSYELKVGMQMRREDEGDWFLTDSGSSATRRRVVVSRGKSSGGTRTAGATSSNQGGVEMPVDQAEPEVIVVESDPQAEIPAVENSQVEGGEVAPAAAGDAGGVTDPVLLRLMQRRQQMNQ